MKGCPLGCVAQKSMYHTCGIAKQVSWCNFNVIPSDRTGIFVKTLPKYSESLIVAAFATFGQKLYKSFPRLPTASNALKLDKLWQVGQLSGTRCAHWARWNALLKPHGIPLYPMGEACFPWKAVRWGVLLRKACITPVELQNKWARAISRWYLLTGLPYLCKHCKSTQNRWLWHLTTFGQKP